MKTKIIVLLSVLILSLSMCFACQWENPNGSDKDSGSESVIESGSETIDESESATETGDESESASEKESESKSEHTHVYDRVTMTVAPTLTAEGKATLKCECGEAKEETVPSLSDSTVWVKVNTIDPCVGGDVTYRSEKYGDVTITVAGNHVAGTHVPAKAATCTEDGNVEYWICTGCGKYIDDNLNVIANVVIAKTGHTAGAAVRENEKAATCTAEGSYDEVVKCKVCGEELSRTTVKVAKLDHTPADAVRENEKAATCIAEGSYTEVVKCSVCDKEISRKEVVEPIADHNFVGGFCSVCHLAESYSGGSVNLYGVVRVFSSGLTVFKANGVADDYAIKYDSSFYANATLKLEWVNYATGLVKLLSVYKDASSSGEGEWGEEGYAAEGGYAVYASDFKTDIYYGYLDKETGIIVVGYDKGSELIGVSNYVFIPSTENIAASVIVSSGLGNNNPKTMTIALSEESKVSLLVADGKVVFGVDFVDLDGNALGAKDIETSAAFIVKQGDAEVKAYGLNENGNVAELDAVHGVYTGEEGALRLSGLGNATFGDKVGVYAVNDGIVGLYIKENGAVTEYYEITLAGATYTAVKPMVTVSFDLGEHGTKESVSVNKNIAYTLETLADDGNYLFRGWKLNGKTVSEETVTPDKDITLVAIWRIKTLINVTDEVNGNESFYGGVGEIILDIIAGHVTAHGYRVFDKYVIVTEDGNVDLASDDEILEDDEVLEIIAIYKADYVVKVVTGNAELADVDVHIPEGGVIASYLPEYDGYIGGYVFDGWFKDAAYEIALSDAEVISAGVTNVYAKWKVAKYPFVGTIHGFYMTSSSGTYNPYKYGGEKTIKFDTEGKTLDDSYSWKNPAVENYNEATGEFTLDGTKCRYDKATGILVIGSNIYVVGASDVRFAKNGSADLAGYCNSQKLKLMRLAYTINGVVKEMNVLFYNDEIYANILAYTRTADSEYAAYTDFYRIGSSIPAFLKITDENGVTIKQFKGATGGSMVELDAYIGTYAFGEKTVVFDGLGNAEYDGKTGTYAVKDAEAKSFDVYLANGTEYYVITLGAENTCTVVKPEVTITFVTGEGHDEVAAAAYNINVVATLPEPHEEASKFIGWFLDPECTVAVAEDFKPTENITLYAKFVAGIKITVVFGTEDLADTFVVVTSGANIAEALESVKPEGTVGADNKLFGGWYLDESLETELTAEAVVSEAITIYCKWDNAHAMMGEYLYGANLDPSESKVVKETDTLSKNGSYKLIVDAFGKATGFKSGSVENYNEDDGTFVINVSGNKYYGGFNAELGIVYVEYSPNKATAYHDIGFMVKELDGGYIPTKTFNTAWDKGITKFVRITYAKDGAEIYKYILIKNRVISVVSDWSAANSDGVAVTDFEKIYTDAKSLTLMIGGVENAYMKISDNFELRGNEFGDYENETEGAMHFDGFGNVTFGETKGTYVAIDNEGKYAITLSDGTYFEVTVTENTYIKVIPTVTVTYEYNGHGESAENLPIVVNKNSNYTLIDEPTADGYIFRGWYLNEGLTTKAGATIKVSADTVIYAKWDAAATVKFVDGETEVKSVDSYYVNDKVTKEDAEYALASDATRRFVAWYTKDGTDGDWGAKVTSSTVVAGENVTFYAKFDKAITITVVYGNGMDTDTITGKFATDKVTLDLPAAKDGLTAIGWFTDEDLTNEWKSGSAVENDLTLYCKWAVAHVMYGQYVGAESWSSTSFSSGKKLAIDVVGKGTGYKAGEITDYNEATGAFVYVSGTSKYSGSYDADAKALAINYSTSGALGTDVYLFALGSGTMTKKSLVTFDSNETRIVLVTVDGADFYMVVKDDKLYAKVDVSGVDASGAAVEDLSKAVMITVKRGDVQVLKFAIEDGKTKNADGLNGTYTGDYGEIVVDGYGNITVGGSTVKYTVVEGKKITFVAANAQRIVELGTDTYAKVLDGFEGTYTLPDGTSTIVLDGFGGAGEGKTYVVANGSITIYDGETAVNYGIDVENKQFLGKSAFAGKTFAGSYYCSFDYNDGEGPIGTTLLKIIFDDSAVISGVLYSGSDTTYYFNFTATLEGDTITFTFTKAIDSSAAGKTLKATISGDTITFVKGGTYSSNMYTFTNSGSARCDGFSL